MQLPGQKTSVRNTEGTTENAIAEGQAVEYHPGLFGRVRLVVARFRVFAHVIFATGVNTDIAIGCAVDEDAGLDQNPLAGKPLRVKREDRLRFFGRHAGEGTCRARAAQHYWIAHPRARCSRNWASL